LTVSRGQHRRGDDGQTGRPAVYLDRDGTVIEHVHYIADPAHVRLLPGAAEALRRLVGAGFALVVVTNQSAIGRGFIAVEQYEAVDAEMRRQLAAEGLKLDGVYYCPDVSELDDPTIVTHDDRKPGPGMILRAARELGLDPSRSWMIGDMVSDVLAGRNAGCLGIILVRTGKAAVVEVPAGDPPCIIADDLPAAAEVILRSLEAPAQPPRGDLP
jgi:histidinol-phosphate phosphatase family protein